MKAAVIIQKGLNIFLDDYLYLFKNVSLILSGGTTKTDKLVEEFAMQNGIPKLVFDRFYDICPQLAVLKGRINLIDQADLVIIFWDGISNLMKDFIAYAKKKGKIVCPCDIK